MKPALPAVGVCAFRPAASSHTLPVVPERTQNVPGVTSMNEIASKEWTI